MSSSVSRRPVGVELRAAPRAVCSEDPSFETAPGTAPNDAARDLRSHSSESARPHKAEDETAALPGSRLLLVFPHQFVGAIGIEPTTPTVSTLQLAA